MGGGERIVILRLVDGREVGRRVIEGDLRLWQVVCSRVASLRRVRV